ncbi:hypothetical protein, partial [Heyndrickxia coagulans]|uniref:hypothetical protein n=1 Tax=Heyndrickxia coagulans TaxID=1398 RepID=UPI002E1AD7A8|nr:hypothetical protein [Heyndrickxia coagulans]
TIYKWIRKQKPVKLDDGSSFTPEEFLNLQKELHRYQILSRQRPLDKSFPIKTSGKRFAAWRG